MCRSSKDIVLIAFIFVISFLNNFFVVFRSRFIFVIIAFAALSFLSLEITCDALYPILHNKRNTRNHIVTWLKQLTILLISRHKSLNILHLYKQILNGVKILKIKNSIQNSILNLISFHIIIPFNHLCNLLLVSNNLRNWR